MRSSTRITSFAFLWTVLLLLAGLGSSPVSFAQGAATQNQPAAENKSTTSARMDRLTKQLNLTGDQQSKLRPIIEQEEKQMYAVRKDDTVSAQARRDKMAQIRQMTKPQIQAILTPDQQKKFDQMKPDRDEK